MSLTTSSSSLNAGAEENEMDCSSQTEEDRNVCWICLEGESPVRPLVQPCKCPRYCHSRCLARWQLQSAGTKRESQCDFCNELLPDWRQVLSIDLAEFDAPAIMNVNFEGQTYSFEVTSGTSGYAQFTEAIRRAFQLPSDSELNITFTCDEPTTEAGSLLTLQGAGAYDAAVYCASISAARRQLVQRSLSQSLNALHDMDASNGSSISLLENNEESQQQQQYITRHHRSRTSLESEQRGRRRRGGGGRRFATVSRDEEEFRSPSASAPVRLRHTRARSLFTLPNSSNNSVSGSGTRTNTLTNDREIQQRKSWMKVAKKMKAIYNKITQK
eukprot:g792.t1